MGEHHVYGPPGSGKTRYLAEQVERAAGKFGINKVLVSSFTRAAAHEIATRSIRLARDNVGTLHSICWRALGRPTIAESKVDEFNEASPFQLSSRRPDLEERDDPGTRQSRGDQLLERYCLMRNRMEDVAEIGTRELRSFAAAWEGWKQESGHLDFCDLIEQGRERFNLPPGGASGPPCVAFIDEAQDLNAMELSLVRKWASRMEHLILVGDDDQALYDFTGADVRNMIDQPAESTIVLKRSHRLPRAVHEVASQFIQKCKVRQPKEFQCRDAEGEAMQVRFDSSSPALIELVEEEIRAGRKVMLLASCSYMLHSPLSMLRAAGIAWHNPYRTNNGAWNPIRLGPKSTPHKLWCYLQGQMIDGEGPYWTGAQLARWIDLVNSTGLLRPNGRKAIEELGKQRPNDKIGPMQWRTFFLTQPFEFWQSGTTDARLSWITNRAAVKSARMLDFAGRIAHRGGSDKLISVPKTTVGTIHSVKGAETDTVILLPDVSHRALETAKLGSTIMDGMIVPNENIDPLLRTFYVGMTRAREKLIVLQPRSPIHKCPYLGKMLPLKG